MDEAELANRRAFFELSDDDLSRLAALRPFAEKCTGTVVDDFYALLLAHAETKTFLRDDATIRRVKRTQRDYFLGLFAGRCDLSYVEDRLRIGVAHERIGLSTTWYLGAYRKYMELIFTRLCAEIGEPRRLELAFQSIQKLVFFDAAIACDAYVAAKLDALERHETTLRALSTPVILVHDRILLLPLIGVIDDQRAEQVIDSVLCKVGEANARSIIIDIEGVPSVDARFADNLVKTATAARLLGAATILTGITPQVARTIVQLGVDISALHTVSRLSDGIELALSLTGKSIDHAGVKHTRGCAPLAGAPGLARPTPRS